MCCDIAAFESGGVGGVIVVLERCVSIPMLAGGDIYQKREREPKIN